jgi:hypothetical protein
MKLLKNCLFRSGIYNINVRKRYLSNANNSDPFLVETKNNYNYAILKFNKPPVNSLNLETLSLVNKQFDSFEKDTKVKGVILTSVSFCFIYKLVLNKS